ncbi:ankyrin repeat domain-containing protein [Ectopseudomonas hydrolytica]|uniref:ankyrin repeat domain-containing protein n=1 Tax=Ectopseudomonas hydrolytica TaxID=2493633 RepID=UPI003EE3CFB3
MDTTTLALLDAAAAGDLERVRQLAQAGANLNALDDGETLLDRAVSAFTLPDSVPAFAADMLRLLLQLGADPNRTGDEGMTALHTAMLARNVELMRILLEGGAEPNGMPGFGPDGTLYDWAEVDYRYSTWDEPFGLQGSLMPPDAPTSADEASEDAWLLYLDRCAAKHGARRPDYLFLLREFGARTAEELGRNR